MSNVHITWQQQLSFKIDNSSVLARAAKTNTVYDLPTSVNLTAKLFNDQLIPAAVSMLLHHEEEEILYSPVTPD